MQTVQCELVSQVPEETYNQVKGRSLRIPASFTDHKVAASTSTRTQPWLVPLKCRTRLFPVGTGLGEKCTPRVLKATGEEARLGTKPGSKAYLSPAILQGQVCAEGVRCAGDTSQQVHLPLPTNDLIIGACNGQRWGGGHSRQPATRSQFLSPKMCDSLVVPRATGLSALGLLLVIRLPEPRPHLRGTILRPSRNTRSQGVRPRLHGMLMRQGRAGALRSLGAPGLTSTALAPTRFFPSPVALPEGGPRPKSEATSFGNQLRCACARAPRCAALGPGPIPSPSPRLPDAGVTSPRRAAAITESRVPS